MISLLNPFANSSNKKDTFTNSPHLILFFTKNYSLKKWHDSGKFGRETAIYNHYTKNGFRISFVSYGQVEELEYQDKIPDINILYNKWKLPKILYNSLIPLLHAKTIKKAQIIKTNQLSGSVVAMWSSWLWSIPLVVRCGYLLSEFALLKKRNPIQLFYTSLIEKIVFSNAKRIIVASPSMRGCINKKYSIQSDKIDVINNYVLTDLFAPKPIESSPKSLCYVARLVEQKNHLALIEACKYLNIKLVLIGNGKLKNSIINSAKQNNVKILLKEKLFQAEMPDVLCRSEIYIHPSLYEGSPPKALLEAMSCGLPVICADSPGIREIIQHGKNGWLCGTSSNEILAAINRLHSDKQLRDSIGHNARKFIVKHFSFKELSQKEISLMVTNFTTRKNINKGYAKNR